MKPLCRSLLLPGLLAATVLTAPAQPPAPFTGYPGAQWPDKAKPTPDDYKLSHDDFLTRYGVTDTAAAISHMYLRKHTTAMLNAQVVSSAAMFAGMVVPATANLGTNTTGNPRSPNDRTYPGWVAPVMFGSLGVILVNLLRAEVWSRRECYEVLYQYNKTRVLPPKVRHRLTAYLIKTRNHEFEE